MTSCVTIRWCSASTATCYAVLRHLEAGSYRAARSYGQREIAPPRLARRPPDIDIGQVVRDTEELDVIGCLGQRGYCPIERICVLSGVLRDATEAFLAELDAYTLADLIKPRKGLSSLLVLDQPTARR